MTNLAVFGTELSIQQRSLFSSLALPGEEKVSRHHQPSAPRCETVDEMGTKNGRCALARVKIISETACQEIIVASTVKGRWISCE